jgi:hypothetical protein
MQLRINNLGQQAVNSFQVGLSIDQADAVLFNINQAIAANESIWVTIENGFILQPDQIYDIAVFTKHPQDINFANDSLFISNYLMAQYHNSFEDTDNITGWTSVSLAGTQQWQRLNSPNVARTGNHVYAIRTDSNSGNTQTNDWLFSECFYLDAGTCYEISFYYRSHFSTENLSLHMGTGNTPADMSTMLFEHQQFNSNSWLKATAQFTVDVSGVYHFGWHSLRPITTGAYFVYIDDVSVVEDLENQPTCISSVFGS